VSHKEKKRKSGQTATELYEKRGQIYEKEILQGKKKKIKLGRKAKMS